MTLQRFAVEHRSEITGDYLVGYASVFNQFADLGSHFEEIAPPAFKRALDDPQTDVRCLFNHDPSMLLGRQASGTLQIGTDSHGMEYRAKLPNTQLGRDVRELAERGDLSGSSFAFTPDEDEWSTRSGRRVRTHTSVGRLVDVSPVTFPAYDGATVALRSLDLGSGRSAGTDRSRLIRARHRVLIAHLGGRDR